MSKELERKVAEWAEYCLSTTVELEEVEIDTTDEVLRKLGAGGRRAGRWAREVETKRLSDGSKR